MGIGKMFSDPNLFSKLAANPRTAKLLADASFMQKVCIIIIPLFSPLWDAHTRLIFQLKLIQQNPQLAQSLLSGDPRMIDVLGALMGIDMQGFNRQEGSDEVPPGMPSASSPPTSPSPSTTHAPPPPSSSKAREEPADVKMAEAEAEEEAIDAEDAAAKKAAEAEKKLGAEAYKKRDFATAITHFGKAWETWPKDITFLTNLGGGVFVAAFRILAGALMCCVVLYSGIL